MLGMLKLALAIGVVGFVLILGSVAVEEWLLN